MLNISFKTMKRHNLSIVIKIKPIYHHVRGEDSPVSEFAENQPHLTHHITRKRFSLVLFDHLLADVAQAWLPFDDEFVEFHHQVRRFLRPNARSKYKRQIMSKCYSRNIDEVESCSVTRQTSGELVRLLPYR